MRFSELCQFSRHPTAPYCHRHVSFTMHCLAPEDNRTDLEPEIRLWIQVNVFKMCAVTPKTGTGTCLGYRGADSRETDLAQYQEVMDGFGKHVATWNGLCKGVLHPRRDVVITVRGAGGVITQASVIMRLI